MICVGMYVCVHAFVHAFVCVCVCACVHAYVCMYASVHVYIYSLQIHIPTVTRYCSHSPNGVAVTCTHAPTSFQILAHVVADHAHVVADDAHDVARTHTLTHARVLQGMPFTVRRSLP